MMDKELKKLSRGQLLELLLEVSKDAEKSKADIEELKEKHKSELAMMNANHQKQMQEMIEKHQAELQEVKSTTADQTIKLTEAGSIAEAALKVQDIFVVAQRAADQYLESVAELTKNQTELCAKREEESRTKAEVILMDAQRQSEKMQAEMQARCQQMLAQAQIESEEYWKGVSERLEAFYSSHVGLREILNVPTGTGPVQEIEE